jgi:signal transduction histidine kinase/CHASE2 domain-containing sensor protein
LLLGLVGLLSLTYPVQEMSRRLNDIYFRLLKPATTSQHVALVLIDDASLQQFGRWPWPRSVLARLVLAVQAQHPRAIGLDVLLSEPSDERDDKALASAFQTAGDVVLPTRIDALANGSGWMGPLPIFEHSAAAVGQVGVRLGPDGICRQIPAEQMSANGPIPAFSIQIARIASRSGPPIPLLQRLAPPAQTSAWGGERLVPRFITIPYRGQVGLDQAHPPFTAVSAASLLNGKPGPSLRNKAVLIGVAAEGIPDRYATPVSDRLLMPGVEVNANLVDGFLSGRTPQPLSPGLEAFVLFASSLFLTWLLLQWPGWRGLLILSSLTVGGYLAGFWLFAETGQLIAYGPFLCLAVLMAPLAQLENLLMVDRGLTRSLHDLQKTLGKPFGRNSTLRAATAGEPGAARGALHWKIATVNSLEAELSSLYAFDETLLKSMQEALAVFSVDGRLLYKNPRWDELAAKLGWKVEPTLNQFAAAIGQPIWSTLPDEGEGAGTPLETEILNDKGLWQVSGIRLPSAQPGTVGPLMVVITDFTDRLERDRARAEALGFVTHELRTPLVSIQGFAEFLLRYPESAGSEQAAETIFRESKRLVAMTNTYLDVLRLESGVRPSQNDSIDIPAMLDHLQRVMQPLAESVNMTVTVEAPSASIPLRGDATLIAGALLNLLSNAVKYGSRGSQVRLKVSSTPNHVAFEVWNHGPVIPAKDLARLFEPYYRRPEQESSVAGWGLGLAFVRRIASDHGGSVEASSDSQAGTCFRFILPTQPLRSNEATP